MADDDTETARPPRGRTAGLVAFGVISTSIVATVLALIAIADGRDMIPSLAALVVFPVLATLVWDWYVDENH